MKKVGVLVILVAIFLLSFDCFGDFTLEFSSKGIPFIRAVSAYKNGFLIYSLTKGFIYFDLKARKLESLQKLNALVGKNTVTFIRNYSNFIFLGTSKGVIVLDSELNLYDVVDKSKGLNDENITCLSLSDQYLYIGTRFWGVYQYDYVNKLLFKTPITSLEGLSDNSIRSIYFDNFNRIVASSEGISIFDNISRFFISYDSQSFPIFSKSINNLIFDGFSVWIGSSLGLVRFDVRSEIVSRTKVDSAILSMESMGNILLLGTYEGLIFYDTVNNSFFRNELGVFNALPISAISVYGDKIFISGDSKEGDFGVISVKDIPIVNITKAVYTSKNLLSIFADVLNSRAISKTAVRIYSFNLGREVPIQKINLNISDGKNKKIIDIDTSTLLSDVYILELEYQYKTEKFRSSMSFFVDNLPPVISISPVPPSTSEKRIIISGKFKDSDMNGMIFKNENSEFRGVFDNISRTFFGNVDLLIGSNNISVVSYDVFGNYSTNSVFVIFDDVKPEIVSLDGSTLIERNGVFSFKVIEKYFDRVTFSENVKNVNITSDKDGVFVSFSLSKKDLTNISVYAYDKAGNVSKKDFQVKFEEFKNDVVVKYVPEKVYSQFLPFEVRFDGDFSRAIVYLQGRVYLALEKPKGTFSTNLLLESGMNVIKIEAFPVVGNIISKVYKVEFIQTVVAKKTVDVPTVVGDFVPKSDYLKLKEDYEKLLARVEELEKMLKSRTTVVEGKTYVIKVEENELFPAIIQVSYNPTVDNFSKISKKIYGSESFSAYFYYFFSNNELVKEFLERTGTIFVPNKKLMYQIVRKGSELVLVSIGRIIQEYMMRYLGKEYSGSFPDDIRKINNNTFIAGQTRINFYKEGKFIRVNMD